MSRPFEVLSIERVFDGFFAVDRASVSFGLVDGGMSSPHERLSVERGDSAAALVHLVDEDCFLLVRQFRFPCLKHGNEWLLEAVAGKIDGSEDPATAIRREIVEEIGFTVGELTKVGAFYGSPGGLSELTHVYYVPVHSSDKVGAGGGVDAGEDIEIVRIPTREAVEMAKTGQIHDGKALIALLWFAAR